MSIFSLRSCNKVADHLSVGGDSSQKRCQSFGSAGFTLIELMLVITVMTMMTAMLLVSDRRFDSSILLRSLAYEVGFSMRTAQLYGVSVREVSVGSGNFNAAYGISVPVSIINVPGASYPLFADLNQDGIFSASTEPTIESYVLQSPFSISNICALNGSSMICAKTCPSPLPAGINSCSPQMVANNITISFRRPDPNAIVTVDSNSSQLYTGAIIMVTSPVGSTRSASITSTGLISVQ